MYLSLLIHSSTEGHLSCFQVWTVMNKAALSILLYVWVNFAPHYGQHSSHSLKVPI